MKRRIRCSAIHETALCIAIIYSLELIWHMIVYNTDKIADYNFASDYAFLDVTQITPAE